MLLFAVILTLCYITYLICEKILNDKYLSSFQYIIHVNGTRGKTSVCRLIDANLRGAGYRVFTKTTGSTPFYIGTDGAEHRIPRKGPANIREQLRIIRNAHREKAQVLIIECMAVNPQLQLVAQSRIVKGNLNVITNVRYDHIFEMGETLDEIAQSLSNTIPRDGLLFTADETYFSYFESLCREKNSTAVLCRAGGPAKDENTAIALEIGRHLGIRDADFPKNIESYKEDFGARKFYRLDGGGVFLNLFSVNDPQSTRNVLREYANRTEDVTFIYNHRLDRPDRLLLFTRYFFPGLEYKRIVVIGENKRFALRMLKKSGCRRVESAKSWEDVLHRKDASFMAGIGNIKGEAYELLHYLEAKGTKR